mgnify:CR=1 FL=1
MEVRRSESTLERRFHTGDVEIRTVGTQRVIEGYAAVFGKRSANLGGFVEMVRDTAFNKTVKEADVRALFNHDENLVLGRSRSGTLRVAPDSRGLHYEITPGDTSYTRDLEIMLERGDVDQSSFAFRAISDDWDTTEDGYPLRSLNEVALFDVSVVTYPAYPDATSGINRSSALYGLSKRSGRPLDEFRTDEDILRAIKGEEERESTEDIQPVAATGVTMWQKRARFAADLERILREESE